MAVCATSVGGTEFVVFASTGVASGTHTQFGFSVPDLDLAVEGPGRTGRGLRGRRRRGGRSLPVHGRLGERATWFRDSEGNLLGMGQYVYS